MELRDPVHGQIHFLEEENLIIQHPFFQRLRNIKQLGFSEYVFPGATHTRFLHSVGVMSIGTKVFDKLFSKQLQNPLFQRLRETFRMACLLHDIGHAPLSHSTESVMPQLSKLELPKRFLQDTTIDRQANHEDYTIKSIVDSSFSQTFKALENKFNIDKNCIADLIIGHTNDIQYFTIAGINYFPLLRQLVSSEVDCDRMDYLLKDSYFCGVSYGNFDMDWLIDNLDCCVINDQAYLGISERAVVTFDDFLLSRFHMFLMVYFHYRSVCLEQMLLKYFKEGPEEYLIPSDIEEYLLHDDHYIMKILRNSKNIHARGIVHNRIPEKVFESFNDRQLSTLNQIKDILKSNNIDYIKCSSSGRLSKYYSGKSEPKENNYPIKVSRKLFGKTIDSFPNIFEVTDLFQKFSKSHEVCRLHFDLPSLPPKINREIRDIIDMSS